MSTTAMARGGSARVGEYRRRVDEADWDAITVEVNELGCALTAPLIAATDADRIVGLYDRDELFRSTTPLILKYGQGDWNALHRDLYGDLVFPLQVVINLSRPGVDHTGGEFLIVEQRPRAQSRGTVTVIPHGHGLVLTTRDRPIRSQRGWSAAPVRHGVSTVRSGQRYTLGLLFHDAT